MWTVQVPEEYGTCSATGWTESSPTIPIPALQEREQVSDEKGVAARRSDALRLEGTLLNLPLRVSDE